MVEANETTTEISAEETARIKAITPLDQSNIGNKMLKSMGWSEGTGLGRHGQGMNFSLHELKNTNFQGFLGDFIITDYITNFRHCEPNSSRTKSPRNWSWRGEPSSTRWFIRPEPKFSLETAHDSTLE